MHAQSHVKRIIETRDEELEDNSVDETRPVTKSKKFDFNFQVA